MGTKGPPRPRPKCKPRPKPSEATDMEKQAPIQTPAQKKKPLNPVVKYGNLILMKFVGKYYEVPGNAICIKQDGVNGKPMWFTYDVKFKKVGAKYEWEKILPQGVMWNYCDKAITDTRDLCATCKNDSGACTSSVTFGFGIGEDNVIECDSYELQS